MSVREEQTVKTRNGWGWIKGFGYANGTPERSVLETPDYQALYEDARERLTQVEEVLLNVPAHRAVGDALDIILAEQV
ncbi:hypothetical protein phiHau3_58 [Streptomyces phage phiHau3]|uniref:Uncharacterized protein n=1 Tax=Streptomyces phage phiHau3 TaxID=1204524 RepID=K4HY45_9CAUD|nr:hypothetical protein phiHau3_58 [Streptomyces phage phiHau3]AFU62036.1 hypothetical protein phiHau3_58 [Streptomyces phage phiHau3]